MMEFDKEAFLDTFRAEAEEHLQKIEAGLLVIEKNEGDKELMNSLYRNAHSLKGSSSLMGFDDICETAHSMEDLFGEIRDLEPPVDSQIIDSLLNLLDQLKVQVDELGRTPEANEKTLSKPAEKTEPKVNQSASGVIEKIIAGAYSEKPVEVAPEPVAAKPEPTTCQDEITAPVCPIGAKEMDTIRVAVAKLDALLNLAGEMVVNKLSFESPLNDINLFQQKIHQFSSIINDLKEVVNDESEPVVKRDNGELNVYLQELENLVIDMKDSTFHVYENLKEIVGRLDLVSNNMQQKIMAARMLPISTIFNLFPRAVRDMAKESDKQVDLVLRGEEVELDKKIIEDIREPLMHLIRNAVDHGIEPVDTRIKKGKKPQGQIILAASAEGSHINISIEDDGAGISLESIKKTILRRQLVDQEKLAGMSQSEILDFIFHPGFSTREIITDVSGRGVGMDVVKKNIGLLKGLIAIENRLGRGVKVTLKLPLTLTIIQALVIEVRGELFCVPLSLIEENLRLSPEEVTWAENNRVIKLRERIIPLVDLGALLRLPAVAGQDEENDRITAILVGSAEERIGFIVDRLHGKREIVSKSLSENLRSVRKISGATILSDGRVSLILNISALLDSAKSYRPEKEPALAGDAIGKAKRKNRRRILVVDDSLITRQLEKDILESAGYEVETAVDGMKGLERLRHAKFDLVVTDVEMPNLDGFELTSAIKTSGALSSIPVVIVTSMQDDKDKARGVQVGADAYVVKSDFEQKNLVEIVGLLIGEN